MLALNGLPQSEALPRIAPHKPLRLQRRPDLRIPARDCAVRTTRTGSASSPGWFLIRLPRMGCAGWPPVPDPMRRCQAVPPPPATAAIAPPLVNDVHCTHDVQRIFHLRSDIDSPKLVRLLGAWSGVPGETPGTDVAERLGRWLNAFDAVGLQSAHQSIRGIRSTAVRTTATAVSAEALSADV